MTPPERATEWRKLFDNTFDHHKFVDVSADGALLYVHAILWSGSHNTDGSVPTGAVKLIARRWGWPNPEALAESLVLAGLWELADEGYRIHDYLDHQEGSEIRLARSRAAKESGSRGGRKSVSQAKRRGDGKFVSRKTSSGQGSQGSSQGPTEGSAKHTRRDDREREQTTMSAPSADQGSLLPDPVVEVFESWQATMKHPRGVKLTPPRRRLIRKALDWGYSVDDLKRSVTGWQRSPFHRGDNDRHTVYNDLELILRDAKHIEMFRDISERQVRSKASEYPGTF